MCGRFRLSASVERLREFFPLFEFPFASPRLNIAPTQTVLAARHTEGAGTHVSALRWGLIPSWAKEKKIGASLINARADTVAAKPAFRAAFKRRRCLVLADGFYEWKKEPGKKEKQPFHFRMKDGRPFAFAGLWESWSGEEAVIESCTLITTDANEVVRPLHDRMPVILRPGDYERWLDPSPQDPAIHQEMLRPFDVDQMEAEPVADPQILVRGNA